MRSEAAPDRSDAEIHALNHRLLLLGHRGARAVKSIPENTLASFDRALADGCDGFEFDVRLSADRVPVVCHDPRHGKLEIARTPAEQLDLPLLRDVVAAYHDKAFLDIELKVAGIERIAAELLRQHPPQKKFVISSFLAEVLEALHQADAGLPLGLICETKAQLQLWRKLPVSYVIPQRRLVGKELLDELKSAGKKILVWTVNDGRGMRRFVATGVDGIISDDPAKLLRQFRD
jgi:glycerophosphoryl diester phosphodiesterase